MVRQRDRRQRGGGGAQLFVFYAKPTRLTRNPITKFVIIFSSMNWSLSLNLTLLRHRTSRRPQLISHLSSPIGFDLV